MNTEKQCRESGEEACGVLYCCKCKDCCLGGASRKISQSKIDPNTGRHATRFGLEKGRGKKEKIKYLELVAII